MGSTIKISVIATGFDEKQLGYAASNKPFFGAYTRESGTRLAKEKSEAQAAVDTTPRIDRAPSSFTQPVTSAQVTQPVQPSAQPVPSASSFGFGSAPATPAPQDDQKPSTPLPISQVGGANEFEDEFDIPAFLRKK